MTAVADFSTTARRKELLHALMLEHSQALLAYTETLLSDRHLAEDIVQETLIRAWRHAERLYSTEGSIRGWLLTVARNLVIDRSRSAASRHEAIGADHQDLLAPDHADTVLTYVEAIGLLRRLSREHREVLLHTYLRGKTVQETARILGIPAGTVKSRQHYALSSLRSQVRTHAEPASEAYLPDSEHTALGHARAS
jgi:RNA polymerase sigma-70 factor (ECF subfamily)